MVISTIILVPWPPSAGRWSQTITNQNHFAESDILVLYIFLCKSSVCLTLNILFKRNCIFYCMRLFLSLSLSANVKFVMDYRPCSRCRGQRSPPGLDISQSSDLWPSAAIQNITWSAGLLVYPRNTALIQNISQFSHYLQLRQEANPFSASQGRGTLMYQAGGGSHLRIKVIIACSDVCSYKVGLNISIWTVENIQRFLIFEHFKIETSWCFSHQRVFRSDHITGKL